MIIGISLLLSGCVSEGKPLTQVEQSDHAFTGLIEQHATANRITVNESKAIWEQYGIINEKDILKNLPSKTNTFEKEKEWVNGGEGVLLGIIDENNYQQPDFYPTFETSGKKTWINAMGEKSYVLGVMSTPADQEAVLTNEIREFETYLFVGAGWGTTTHQGVKLRAAVEPNESGITIAITPNEFLVGPTFPIIDENWIERVHIEGSVSPEAKEGKYTITILLDNPTEQNENEWVTTHTEYARANTSFVDPRGLATLTLTIPEKSKEN